jgi:hypothetical protein
VNPVARSAPTLVKTMNGSAPPSAVAQAMCDGFVERGRYRAMSGLLMNDSGVDARMVNPIDTDDHSAAPLSCCGAAYCQSTVGRMNAVTSRKIANSAAAITG